MNHWKQTDNKTGNFTYRREGQGRGKNARHIIGSEIRLHSSSPTLAELTEVFAAYEWAEGVEPRLSIETDCYTYGYDTQYLAIVGDHYANETEVSQILAFEAEQEAKERTAKEAKEAKERAEYERLNKIYGSK